jgi:hypothetical protein
VSSSKNKRPIVEAKAELPLDEAPDFDNMRPTFCLQHLHAGFDVKHKDMTQKGKAALLDQLRMLASLTWVDIRKSGRHKLGWEKIPVKQLKLSMPTVFEDETDVLVFRYDGNLPMAGVRRGAMLHLIAVERKFGQLYDH